MLNKIRSSYVLKQILDNLDNEKKLNLVKYSKKLQNKLDLDIYDYRRFSGRYIEEMEDGTIIEYNSANGNIIYVGEYFKWKKKWKGKEI